MKNSILWIFGICLVTIVACKKDCEYPISYKMELNAPTEIKSYLIKSNGAYEFLKNENSAINLDSMIARSSASLLSEISFTSEKHFDGKNWDGTELKEIPYFLKNDSLMYSADTSRFYGIVRPDCGGAFLQYLAVSYTNQQVPRSISNQYFATVLISESESENIQRIIRSERLQENDTLFVGIGVLENK